MVNGPVIQSLLNDLNSIDSIIMLAVLHDGLGSKHNSQLQFI